MKSLVLLAVLSVAAAQYTYYTHPGYTPYVYSAKNAYPAVPYSAYPYPLGVVPYSGFRTVPYYGLPYSFKPVEKPAEEESPVVEATRRKRDVSETPVEEEKKTVAYHVPTPYGFPYSAYNPYTAFPNVYSAYQQRPLVYSHFPGYTPYVHHLKKRDTAAAEEDQKADDALVYTSFAGLPYNYNYPTTYTSATYPHIAYSGAAYTGYPRVYSAGYPYNTGFRYFY